MERNKLSILNLSIFEYTDVSECFVHRKCLSSRSFPAVTSQGARNPHGVFDAAVC